MSVLELPSRRGCQSLDGYVREHLQRLERELATGVRYGALVDAARGRQRVARQALSAVGATAGSRN